MLESGGVLTNQYELFGNAQSGVPAASLIVVITVIVYVDIVCTLIKGDLKLGHAVGQV